MRARMLLTHLLALVASLVCGARLGACDTWIPPQSWSVASDIQQAEQLQYLPDLYAHYVMISDESAYFCVRFRDDMTSTKAIFYRPWTPSEAAFMPMISFMRSNGSTSAPVSIPSHMQLPLGYSAEVIMSYTSTTSVFFALLPMAVIKFYETTLYGSAGDLVLIAVTGFTHHGHVAVAVGDGAAFRLDEYLLGPYYALRICSWSGVSIGLYLLPLLVFFLAGAALLASHTFVMERRPQTIYGFCTCLAALLIVGQCFVVAMQLMRIILRTADSDFGDVWITVLFIVAPLVLGAFAFSLGVYDEPSVPLRALQVLLAVLALFVWAGLYIGPALLVLSACLPAKFLPKLRSYRTIALTPQEDDELHGDDELQDGAEESDVMNLDDIVDEAPAAEDEP